MNALQGIALQLVSTLFFAIMQAMVRDASARFPTGEIVFARSFFALLPLIVMLAYRREISSAVRTANPLGHITRGAIGVLGMGLGFSALARIPLADATAISFASPLIVVVLAAAFLGEIVQIYRWSAVAVGFLGVMVMLWPHMGGGVDYGTQGAIGAACGLAGAFCSAGAMIQVRRLTGTETSAAIVFYFQALAAVAGLATAPFGWVMPDLYDAAFLITLGIMGGIGQFLLTESYRSAPASVVAPFAYATMLWAIGLGYLMFGEVPETIVIVGCLIVVAAGLFVIWRERQLGLDRTAAKQASAPTTGGDA